MPVFQTRPRQAAPRTVIIILQLFQIRPLRDDLAKRHAAFKENDGEFFDSGRQCHRHGPRCASRRLGFVIETAILNTHRRAGARHDEPLQLQPVFREHALQHSLYRITPTTRSRVVPFCNGQPIACADRPRGLLQPTGNRRGLGIDDIAQLRADLMPTHNEPLEVDAVLKPILQPHIDRRRHVNTGVHRFPRVFIRRVFRKQRRLIREVPFHADKGRGRTAEPIAGL